MWAHWGPQCPPESGDWYAPPPIPRRSPASRGAHGGLYGHPAKRVLRSSGLAGGALGPGRGVRRAMPAPARAILVAMACHHDNFDLFASPQHGWNSTCARTQARHRRRLGGGGAPAGLRFGVSNHASHAWHWWQTAYGYDTQGPRKGQRYDAFRLRRRRRAASHGRGSIRRSSTPGRARPARRASTVPRRCARGTTQLGAMARDDPAGRRGFREQWLARQMALVETYQPDFLYKDGTACRSARSASPPPRISTTRRSRGAASSRA